MFLMSVEKTTIKQQSKKSNIMKNSILILGIALVSLTTICNASNAHINQINTDKRNFLTDYNEGLVSSKTVTVAKPYLKDEPETFNPESVIGYVTTKTIAEIIMQDDKITEYSNADELEFTALEESMRAVIAQSDLITENIVSNEVYPLYIERTIEDEIAELEMIIESKITNEASPLDFKKINSNSMMINGFNTKTFVGMK
jgi:hypothetical protein